MAGEIVDLRDPMLRLDDRLAFQRPLQSLAAGRDKLARREAADQPRGTLHPGLEGGQGGQPHRVAAGWPRSLASCHAMIVGSFAYAVPVTLLVRPTIARIWRWYIATASARP